MLSGRKRCYYLHPERISGDWYDAEKACLDRGLILWEPKNMEEINTVHELIGTANYWTGVTDSAEEGNVVYNSTGAPFTLPTLSNSEDYDCLTYRPYYDRLEFNSCTSTYRNYVCEKQDPCA